MTFLLQWGRNILFEFIGQKQKKTIFTKVEKFSFKMTKNSFEKSFSKGRKFSLQNKGKYKVVTI
jgi:hypothetical protein